MKDQIKEKEEPCCVNFDISLKTTKRDKRNILLSIQFSETEVQGRFLTNHRMRLVLMRCDFQLKLKNCVLPIFQKTNVNPLTLQSTVTLKESTEDRNRIKHHIKLVGNAEFDNKIGLGTDYRGESGKERVNHLESLSDITTYHVQPGGSESNPTWKFSNHEGKPLIGQYLKETLGELTIKERPPSIHAKVSAWKKDITVIDAEGIFSKSILKQKLMAAYIQSVLGIDRISHSKSVNI